MASAAGPTRLLRHAPWLTVTPVGRHRLRVLDGEVECLLQATSGGVFWVTVHQVRGEKSASHERMIRQLYRTRQGSGVPKWAAQGQSDQVFQHMPRLQPS